MKHRYGLLFVIIVSLIVQCTNNEPTGPDHRALLLNRSFDSVTVRLEYGKEILINNYAMLKFEGVASDSRCPIDAICVWPGNGEVKMSLKAEREKKEFTINTLLEPRSYRFDEFVIELKSLNPSRRSDQQIKPNEYSVDLVIKPAAGGTNSTVPVKLIEGSNTDLIKRDPIEVNSFSLNGDKLVFNVSYSGGCRDHSIELYAFKEIQKTSPAQATLILSHNGNGDMCEAYLTKTASFDLTALKNYLKSAHGINDKALLIIHDSSGRPIRNPVVEYKF